MFTINKNFIAAAAVVVVVVAVVVVVVVDMPSFITALTSEILFSTYISGTFCPAAGQDTENWRKDSTNRHSSN